MDHIIFKKMLLQQSLMSEVILTFLKIIWIANAFRETEANQLKVNETINIFKTDLAIQGLHSQLFNLFETRKSVQ